MVYVHEILGTVGGDASPSTPPAMSPVHPPHFSVPLRSLPALRSLSPTVSFYIRKLIRRNFDQLKLSESEMPVLADGWGDLDRILLALYSNKDKGLDEMAIGAAIDQLEHLARVGQQIDRRTLQKRLEQQNFRLHAEIQNYKQLEDRYRNIFDNAIDGMFQSTPDGQFITANHALAKM